MNKRINQWIDNLSNFLAYKKGLLPMIGLGLIVVNMILHLIPGAGWVETSNIFLHLGLILAILGFMFAWAL
jgi:hypothetical protein